MSSIIEITLPADQLEGTTAKVADWLVAPGTEVLAGDPIVELETDKVTMEICAPESGIINSILKSSGEDVDPDSILGTLSSVAVAVNETPLGEPETALESEPKTTPVENPASNQNIAQLEPAAISTATAAEIEITLSEDQLEGTTAKVAAWLISPGETINEGEPLLELETDKVTMEICAPATGLLSSIVRNVGEEVEPQSLLGTLSTIPQGSEPNSGQQLDQPAEKEAARSNQEPPAQTDQGTNDTNYARHLVGPAVRRLLREKSLDIQLIPGSGRGGRVTRDDVFNYLNNPAAAEQQKAPTQKTNRTAANVGGNLTGTRVPHTPMRKAIANHMVESLLHTSPHVTSVFEMDMSNIIEHRRWHKKEFIEQGVKLTFTAYFLAATVAAMRSVPQMNARFHDDALELFDDINIGVGTALGDEGLVVPVVQQVQEKNLLAIAESLQQQTDKARNGKLKPSDMKNGTFTISNHGVSGSLFAAPIIINQPQVAILGIGKLEKRVVVEEIEGKDVMNIKPMCYVSLSIDHRAVDAFQTNKFLSTFVECIENWGN